MLCLAAGMGRNALSWGISTEERGKVLNFGLVESKEGYASCHAVNLGFTKTFSKKETNDATVSLAATCRWSCPMGRNCTPARACCG